MSVGPDDPCPGCSRRPPVARPLKACIDCLQTEMNLNEEEILMLAGQIEPPTEERLATLEHRVDQFIAGDLKPNHEQSQLF